MKLARIVLALPLLAWSFAIARASIPTSGMQSVDISSAAGVHWEFKPEGGSSWSSIRVPDGGWRNQGYSCDAGTYRARIGVPESMKGKDIRLQFAAINFGTEIYAGTNPSSLQEVATHVDGWVPITADITSCVAPGEPLYVRVDVQGRKKFMYQGKYTVPEGATWYPGLEEGILRGVYLQAFPEVHIDDAYVITTIHPDILHPIITISNSSDHSATVILSGSLTSWNRSNFRYPSLRSFTVHLPAKSTRTVDMGRISWKLGRASYWWPDVPYRHGYRAQLHILHLALKENGVVTDRFRQRFGFRQFRAVEDHYELNGIRCNLRGDNQQEANFGTDAYGVRPGFGPPSKSNPGWPQAVDNLLHLNFNVMRIHQIPATPYMLNVCDEMGLMLVEESPLRGSEGGEDWTHGKVNMENMDRELVLRDRDHPSVVVWSAANEWAQPIPDCEKVIQSVDKTRPIIAEGIGDIGKPYINMVHYVNGGGLPTTGAPVRKHRPYGETEDIWPNDISKQGFAWMATGIRLRRLKGDSDLRNYVLNNAWCNYVPGESNRNEILEIKVKGDKTASIPPPITHPWTNSNIRLMRQCYNPVAVCDVEFDRLNARSDAKGDWPVIKPRIPCDAKVTRTLATFNDEFSGDRVLLKWEVRVGNPRGKLIKEGATLLTIPLGYFKEIPISFRTPKNPCDISLTVSSYKNGQLRFTENRMLFAVVKGYTGERIIDGRYRMVNWNSGLVAEIKGDSDSSNAQAVQGPPNAKTAVWRFKKVGENKYTIQNDASGLFLSAQSGENGALAIQAPADGGRDQMWKAEASGDGAYNLENVKYGKLLDVYGLSRKVGGRIVIWDANGGANQEWDAQYVSR